MKITRETTTALTIRNVSDEFIRVGNRKFTDTIALTTRDVIESWESCPVDELDESNFAELLDTRPELVVLGTGRENRFPPRELVFAFARRGVGLEVMDTRAAARTFNVLVSEGRRVVAVLYL